MATTAAGSELAWAHSGGQLGLTTTEYCPGWELDLARQPPLPG
jgi:hypothetical protein